MLKTCSKCNKEKDLDQFRFRNKAKGTRSPWCKLCFSEYEKLKWKSSVNRRSNNIKHNKSRRVRNCQFIWEYLLKNPCVCCGETDPIVLEFDHRDPTNKRLDISTLSRTSYGLDTIKKEISKCDVLCANCHRRRTANQFGWYENLKF